MKLMPASNAASTQARAWSSRDAAAVGQPRAEADLRDVQVTVSELSESHGHDRSQNAAQVPSGPTTTVGSMAKPAAVQHVCNECGTSSGRWLGRCPGCGEFGTLVAEAVPARGQRRRARAGEPAVRPPLRLVDVVAEESERLSTGVAELDRVLGGGLVPASLVLVGGEPGVGKSTLLLSALGAIARERRALLITGEESVAQVKLRAARLGGCDDVEILAETELDVGLRDARARAARRLRDRLGADALVAGDRLGARLGLAGARGGGAAAARREGGGRRDVPRRPRDEGRLRRRPARARAPRRLRAPVRGRPLPRAPHPPGGQEPLRLDERARRLRDDGRRPDRRPRPVRALRPHATRARSARPSPARSRGRGRCCSRSRRSSRRPTSRCRAASAPASTRSASR